MSLAPLLYHRSAPPPAPRQSGPEEGTLADPIFHFGRGKHLLATGGLDEAAAAFDAALALEPRLAAAHLNRGIVDSRQGRLGDAIAAYERALSIDPNMAEAHNNLGCALHLAGDLAAGFHHFNRAIALKPGSASAYTNLLLALHYVPGIAPRLIGETAQRWAACLPPRTTVIGARTISRSKRRLRIGYVSGDFRTHPVAYFIEGVLAAHDRSDFAVYCYSNAQAVDATTVRIRVAADHWRDISALSDIEAAQQIASDKIDILVDLSGHTSGHRLAVFALRPAPVQCTWLGYVGTTGLPEIDYIIADRHVLPPGEDGLYVERPYRMPYSYLCFTPPRLDLPTQAPPLLRNGVVTFGCFNNLLKLNDGVLDLWSRLLAELPEARLFLKTGQLGVPEIGGAVLEGFARRGIGADRIRLASASPRGELLAAYNEVDVALDPFPFGGGTTTLEALWMGVPVVTLRGDRFAGRVGVSILETTELGALIADDREDYLATAIALAQDRPLLATLRAVLRRRLLDSPLCDAIGFARDLEAAYVAMRHGAHTIERRRA